MRDFLLGVCAHVANAVAPRARVSNHLAQVYAPYLPAAEQEGAERLVLRSNAAEHVFVLALPYADGPPREGVWHDLSVAVGAEKVFPPGAYLVLVRGGVVEQVLWRVAACTRDGQYSTLRIRRILFAARADLSAWRRGTAGGSSVGSADLTCTQLRLDAFLAEVADVPSYRASATTGAG